MTFNEMELAGEIKSALADMGFTQPTPVQREVIPLLLAGRDVLAQAPTGTGKTCAFGIPVISRIDASADRVQALVLCPTRELAVQIDRELSEVLKYTKNINTVCIFGGQDIDRQTARLKRRPQIVIGTTGRVMDHMRRGNLELSGLKMLVLDEVDEMLNMGFKEDIDSILESMPGSGVQTILFSATVPAEIERISRDYQTMPQRVNIINDDAGSRLVTQYYVITDESGKINALTSLLRREHYTLALVFCGTKKRVEEVGSMLSAAGVSCDILHGDLLQRHRDRAMKRFREGKTEVLVSTDVAARGIDVDDIQAVINYDVPQDEEYYIHRIGRTARANKRGAAYTFFTKRQAFLIERFEKASGSNMTRMEKEAAEPQSADAAVNEKRFKKTLKILKKEDLSAYKEYITAELVGSESFDALDVAAALLFQLSRADERASEAAGAGEPKRAGYSGNKRQGNAVRSDFKSGGGEKPDKPRGKSYGGTDKNKDAGKSDKPRGKSYGERGNGKRVSGGRSDKARK